MKVADYVDHTVTTSALSARARTGLAALDPEPRERAEQSIRAMLAAGLPIDTWERYLSAGQTWPDVIEYERSVGSK